MMEITKKINTKLIIILLLFVPILFCIATYSLVNRKEKFTVEVNISEFNEIGFSQDTYNTLQNISLVGNQLDFEIIKLDNSLKQIPKKTNCSLPTNECKFTFKEHRSDPEGLYALMYYGSYLNIKVSKDVIISSEVRINPNQSEEEAKDIVEERLKEIFQSLDLINSELENSSDGCYRGTRLEDFFKIRDKSNYESSSNIIVHENFGPGYIPYYPGDIMESMYLGFDIWGNSDNKYTIDLKVIPKEEDPNDYFNSDEQSISIVIPKTECEDESYLSTPKVHLMSTWSCRNKYGEGENIDVKMYEINEGENTKELVYEYSGLIKCPDESLYNSTN